VSTPTAPTRTTHRSRGRRASSARATSCSSICGPSSTNRARSSAT
jgi:hypothetical protein